MVEAHGRLASDVNYHAMVGKALSGARERFRISEAAKNHRGKGSLWRKRHCDAVTAETTSAGVAPAVVATAPKPVREGRWRAARAMTGSDFAATVGLFDERPAIGGTYFRVVEKGFQPVDLHPASAKPLIGVGSAFSARAAASQLSAEMDAAIRSSSGFRRSGSSGSSRSTVVCSTTSQLLPRMRSRT